MKNAQLNTQTNHPPVHTHDFTALPSQGSLDKTVTALKQNGFLPVVVNSKQEALDTIKRLIPAGSTLMNGTSTTLQQIGFIDFLKNGKHAWRNLHEAILAEADAQKQSLLRRQSVVSDFYLGSVHAVTEQGELLIASASGSQLPHLVYTSPNLLLVVGAQKVTPNLAEAFHRLEEHVIPLEDKRMHSVYGMGTTHSKSVILHKEKSRNVHVIIVREVLGF